LQINKLSATGLNFSYGNGQSESVRRIAGITLLVRSEVTRIENVLQCHFVHHTLGLNSGLFGKKPSNNRLLYGIAV
jgi:hypothetical protein